MSHLAIVKIGNPVLREKAGKVGLRSLGHSKFQKFLKDMVETMHQAEGVGLAANQVGERLQVIVLECESNARYPEKGGIPLQIYLNPRIVKYSREKEEDWEGCLSIPGYRGLVPRAKEVTFEAWNEKEEKVRRSVHGFLARIIQHEVDHLNGFFYVDRMPDLKKWLHLDEFNRILKAAVKDRS